MGRDASLVPGDLLNGIYRVERFIARGGMGEVFEGVNVETDERVAIKAIRNHLASDPKVISLFRKEARTLTQFAHPAIVQYRVFARDPLLDLHYIVTDFIDGVPIAAHLEGAPHSIRDVVILARRLAAGLETAHDHGAIHRDMSPDNVLLPGGNLDRAKIIDFGIAKSLDVTVETVVGDGFAGKLGYVAPEQFGDYGRQVGPWTDVYSTGLVLLAYARGKAPAMGTTLSEAVERRRTGADVVDLPLPLAPLIERMLIPDPAHRIRSMHEVLAALETIRLPDVSPVVLQGIGNPPSVRKRKEGGGQAAPEPAIEQVTTFLPAVEPLAVTGGSPAAAAAPVPVRPNVGRREQFRDRWTSKSWLVIGVPATAAALLAAVLVPGQKPKPALLTPVSTGPSAAEADEPVSRPQLPSADRSRQVSSLLTQMPCAWITARSTTENGTVVLSGGSGDLGALGRRLAGAAGALGSADVSDVHPVNVTHCGVIDALRPYRAAGTDHGSGSLLVSSDKVTLGQGNPTCRGGGSLDVTTAIYGARRDFALISLEPDGRLQQIAGTRRELENLGARNPERFSIGSDGTYHVSVCYNATGTAALILIDSNASIDLGLSTGRAVYPPADFVDRLADQEARHDLNISVEWVRIDPVDPSSAIPAPKPVVVKSASSATVSLPRSASLAVAGQTYAESAVETAAANRQQLDKIMSAKSAAAVGHSANCQAFDTRWKAIGHLERNECIARIFNGQCSISFGMHKNRLYRRQGGYIQKQQGARWQNLIRDQGC
ncbi:serine/threonine-protein kinase [Sphingomonas arantia]|uniref:Serine/threonine-protein kinase n=1 Tax=Sphingomonas arantia TaxID=1460676 RepID=A0ABW4TXP0_9SPHN